MAKQVSTFVSPPAPVLSHGRHFCSHATKNSRASKGVSTPLYSSVCHLARVAIQSHVLTLVPGTPHRGSDLGDIGKVIAGVACAVSPLRAPRALIGMPQRDSDELLHLNEDYVRRASSVKIVSFFETRVTPILGLLKRMVC